MRFVRASLSGRPLPLPGLHDMLWWLLAAGIVVAGLRLVWTIVTPVSPLGDWRPAGVRLMPEGARRALMAGFDPFNRDSGPATASGDSAQVTGMPLTLFGIRYNAATGAGTAIVAGSDGEQVIVSIGEELPGGATLAALEFDHIVINRGGARELLYLDQSRPAPIVAPAAGRESRDAAVEPSAGPALTAQALRSGLAVAPHAEGGSVIGLEVQPRGDGGVFRSAGFRSGDIILAVDRQAITSKNDAARLLEAAVPGSTVALTIRRADGEVPITIMVAP